MLISSISFASAGWWGDIWDKITGFASKYSKQTSYLCTDSDNGSNKFVKGIVTYSLAANTGKNFTDFCYNKYLFSKSSKVLREYSCNPDNRTISRLYECANGCADGACAAETA